MNWSIKLFKAKGIDVKIHHTFVLILIWAAYRWSISTGEGLMGTVFGIVATLLLFASVTLHEFGHSLQALKFGIPVHDITLMPMGGLARIEEIPEDPGKEIRIAIEMKVSQAMTRQPQILRANDGLSKAIDLTLSTSQSDFPVTEWGSNHVVGLLCERDLLKGLQVHDRTTPVRDVMRTTFPTATPDQPLYEAQKHMVSGRLRAMPVVDDDGNIVGLLTATDINEAYRLLSIQQKPKFS